MVKLKLDNNLDALLPDRLYALGFSIYKRPIVRDFFPGRKIIFVDDLSLIPLGASIIVWGRYPKNEIDVCAKGSACCVLERKFDRIIRLEDGFLRSVGLGADLVRPLSWVKDTTGIYFDATTSSDLEDILLKQHFDVTLKSRAAQLRQRIVATGITKYNVGSGRWNRPETAKLVILVPGQVETDASIKYGAPEDICSVRRNMDLLRAVRQANPDAFIVYKPHPDVIAGLRVKGADEDRALNWCDEQVIDVPVETMFSEVDEVHVITSLTGFEALLRAKKVVCYGQPFYAGWGVTTDMVPIFRRDRTLSVDELVAGALILYPTYISLSTGEITTPEQALDELKEWRDRIFDKCILWRRLLRVILRFYKR